MLQHYQITGFLNNIICEYGRVVFIQTSSIFMFSLQLLFSFDLYIIYLDYCYCTWFQYIVV